MNDIKAIYPQRLGLFTEIGIVLKYFFSSVFVFLLGVFGLAKLTSVYAWPGQVYLLTLLLYFMVVFMPFLFWASLKGKQDLCNKAQALKQTVELFEDGILVYDKEASHTIFFEEVDIKVGCVEQEFTGKPSFLNCLLFYRGEHILLGIMSSSHAYAAIPELKNKLSLSKEIIDQIIRVELYEEGFRRLVKKLKIVT